MRSKQGIICLYDEEMGLDCEKCEFARTTEDGRIVCSEYPGNEDPEGFDFEDECEDEEEEREW